MSFILLIILIVLVVGTMPIWPYNTGWGHRPAVGAVIALIIGIALMVTGKI